MSIRTENKRLYQVWLTMRSRCNNPSFISYKNYGGRGISVCKEWDNFDAFLKWAIESGYDQNASRGVCTIDRVDNRGNYCPENCRIVSQKHQNRNKRTNTIVPGTDLCIADFAEKNCVSYGLVCDRLRAKWPLDDLLMPKQKNGAYRNARSK